MAEEQQLRTEELQPTAEATEQRWKREKAATKDAALGVEEFTVEVTGVFKTDLKRVMKAHGINNQQEVHQNLQLNLIAADFETQAQMLKCATTSYEPSEKVSRAFYAQSMSEFANDPGDKNITQN